ncbi:hypothetical protein SAMN05444397_1197 [Flavobacterium aquidurense]|uniref:Uncharacterized protein n=1 Tax=Flavobacterium frigidimaris TaxID=262320 RepID=A0ABX4BJW0_FLAFR|nr:hypothetical protein [Flavobacterium frigidimaris]OXA75864.1 hypothetical protein B0A65_20555 [Flavobacterium frigidimaris]SDZ67165.1 hypothetical protein SAMN05444397_1197 [Flavobacterium aquidurense]
MKEFWLDYAASSYIKLIKKDKDPEIDILLNISFVQSLNVNLVLVIVFKLINVEITDFKYMIISSLLIFLINYFIYNRLSEKEKQRIKNRVPKFKYYIYRLYALFSAIILFVCAYLLRD